MLTRSSSSSLCDIGYASVILRHLECRLCLYSVQLLSMLNLNGSVLIVVAQYPYCDICRQSIVEVGLDAPMEGRTTTAPTKLQEPTRRCCCFCPRGCDKNTETKNCKLFLCCQQDAVITEPLLSWFLHDVVKKLLLKKGADSEVEQDVVDDDEETIQQQEEVRKRCREDEESDLGVSTAIHRSLSNANDVAVPLGNGPTKKEEGEHSIEFFVAVVDYGGNVTSVQLKERARAS